MSQDNRTQVDYGRPPEPVNYQPLQGILRTLLIAAPCLFAGFLGAGLLGAHIAFFSAAAYLGRLPTLSTPPSTIPLPVIAPAWSALLAAIALPALIGGWVLSVREKPGRIFIQFLIPSAIFGVLALIRVSDPFGAWAWTFQ